MEINIDVVNTAPKELPPVTGRLIAAPTLMQSDVGLPESLPTVSISDVIENALRDAGLIVNDKTMDLANAAVAAHMPLTGDTLKTLNRALQLMGGDVEKAVFLARSGVSVNRAAAEALSSLIENGAPILADIEALAKAVGELPDGVFKNRLIEILTTENTSATAAATARTTQTASASNIPVSPQAAEPPIAKETVIPQEAQPQSEIDAKPAPQAGSTDKPPIPPQPQTTTPLEKQPPPPPEKPATDVIGKAVPTAPEKQASAAIEKRAAQTIAPERQADQRGPKPQTLAERIVERFTIAPNTPREHIDAVLSDMTGRLKAVIKHARAQDTPDNEQPAKGGEKPRAIEGETKAQAPLTRIIDHSERIVRNIEFANDVKNAVIAHMPLRIEGRDTEAQLYVFGDKRAKRADKNKGAALLAVDMANIGHVEAYLTRDGLSAGVQFRVGGASREMIAPHTARLEGLLAEKGYSLSRLSFTDPGKRYAITDGEPERVIRQAYSAHILDEKA